MMVQFDRAGQGIAKESNILLAILDKTIKEKEEAIHGKILTWDWSNLTRRTDIINFNDLKL